ncbi:hypothetical protein PS918_03116 [Pseudomonas fluorescens]|uniref:Type II toxin-antitoxin system HicA family toxin n=1 Tax=Pseudomonas fluorescens TaxID=294 RepID=A0A5E7T246_PSEFL|nr:hypothetical protein PS918_03116 [Pseudomonas fluorescens]
MGAGNRKAPAAAEAQFYKYSKFAIHIPNLLYTELTQQRGEVMKYSEFKRWLKARGVRFESLNGTSHFKIYYEGKQTIFPDHGAKEMKEGTRRGIIKQLGLK